MSKISAAQRRQELKEYLDGVGLLNLNKSELGKKYGVSDVCIGKDLKLIMSDSKPGDVTMILKKFDSAFQLALNRALRSLSEAQGNKETNDSIRTLIVVIHEHLSSLARLGYPVSVDGTPPVKPDGEHLRRYLLGLDLGTGIEQNTPREKIPVPYENLHWTNPVVSRQPENTSPQPQKSIVITPEGEDDLIPATNEDIEEEENLNA